MNDGFAKGGEGAAELAEAVADACEQPNEFQMSYDDDDSIEEKICKVAQEGVRREGRRLLPGRAAQDQASSTTTASTSCRSAWRRRTCSLSADPALLNAPEDFELPVRDIRAYTGAGWLVPLCGDIQQMPGLGKAPAALNVDIDAEGRTVGLF